MDVDALDPAAALAGVEAGAVDEVLDRVGEVGVGADVGRVLAAELQVVAGSGWRRRRCTAWPPATLPVKQTRRRAAGRRGAASSSWSACRCWKHAGRQAGLGERLLEALGARAGSGRSA